MGPYAFVASPKVSSPGRGIEVVVCTQVRFLDQAGKPLPDSEIWRAAGLEEALVVVRVRDAQSSAGRLACPE